MSISESDKRNRIRILFTQFSVIIIIAVGLIVMAGWLLDKPFLKGILSDIVKMSFNAGLSFFLSGIAFFLLLPGQISSRTKKISKILSYIVIIFSLATLCEYIFTVELGIDYLIIKTPILLKPFNNGRMSIFTCTSFILIGTSLLLISNNRFKNADLIKVFTTIIQLQCLLTIAVYSFNLYSIYFTLQLNPMALNTGLLLLLFSGSLHIFINYDKKPKALRELYTIGGFTFTIILLFVIGANAIKQNYSLNETDNLTNHTLQVLLTIEKTLSSELSMGTGVRGFTLTGDNVFLESYNASKSTLDNEITSLKNLTQDNPVQQKNIDTLQNFLTENNRILETIIKGRQANSLDSKLIYSLSKTNKYIMDKIRYITGQMSGEENKLLNLRTTRGKNESTNALITLVILLLFSFVILIIIYFILSKNERDRNKIEKTIRELNTELEKKYNILFEKMLDGFALHEIICDEQGKGIDYKFLEVNTAFETMTGMKRDQIIGKRILEVAPETEPYWIESYSNVALQGKSIRIENYAQPFGRYYDVIAFQSGLKQFITIFSDITERKANEAKILKEKKLLQTLAELATAVSSVTTDYKEILNYTARKMSETIGDFCVIRIKSEESELLIEESFYHPDLEVREFFQNRFPDNTFRTDEGVPGDAFKTGRPVFIPIVDSKDLNQLKGVYFEYAQRFGHSSVIVAPISWQNTIIGTLSVSRNKPGNPYSEDDLDFIQNAATKLGFTISNARLLKNQLKEIEERKVLIRELYHRTKNNMQVISSLLGLKSAIIEDEETKNILGDMANRISAIALVHQMLYQSQNLSRVDLKDYITDLARLLMNSYTINHKNLSLVLELESISVVIDTAIPCGLIINELITNSLKYAFPMDRKGEIKIQLAKSGKDIIELKVSDNGIGMPAGYDTTDNKTLGLQIFWNIAEDQLQGEVDFKTDNGVSCSIRFKDALYVERV